MSLTTTSNRFDAASDSAASTRCAVETTWPERARSRASVRAESTWSSTSSTRTPLPLPGCAAGRAVGVAGMNRNDRQVDRECRAAAGSVAGGGDRAAVQLEHGLGDRQPQPQSAEAARDVLLALLEGVEQAGQDVGCDADARV